MSTQVAVWQEAHPALVARGLDEPTWNALKSTIYPGAQDDSILMAVDYCRARKLDPMLKPVHLVPMKVTLKGTAGPDGKDKKVDRDVPMPGIGLYRIQADRSGTYAGADEPVFGPIITRTFTDYDRQIEVSFPEWCKVTVRKLIGDRVVEFTAKEYWLENYAPISGYKDAPNAMWRKRVYGQLGKCTEAQALRKAWPEIGSDPTAEEMMGKHFDADELRDVSPTPAKAAPAARQPAPNKDEAEDAHIIEAGAAQAAEAAPASNEPGDAPVEPIKANHIKMITSKLARFNKDDSDLLHLLQVDSIPSIPLAKLNVAMDYVNNLGKAE